MLACGCSGAAYAMKGLLGPQGAYRVRHAMPSLTLARPLPQVARTMAPSVIYIDEAEKVFITDKKKLREFGSQVRCVRCLVRCTVTPVHENPAQADLRMQVA